MTTPKKSKLVKLLRRYKKIILIWIFGSLLLILISLLIYSFKAPAVNSFEKVLADFLMTLGESLIVAGFIGGGIGGVINFIFEEFKQEEEEKKERLKEIHEAREKRKQFRNSMQAILQKAHDNVELARVLIKSHRSGKTYGEQIRSHIMPSLIALKDFNRRLKNIEDFQLEENLDSLKVSLTYMIAYLTVLMEEFEANYLKISNLQNYQDAMVDRLRTLFTEIAEGKKDGQATLEKKVNFLESAEELFGKLDVPSNFEVVWQAMEELDYLKDFIKELKNKEGVKSMYSIYFLQHYYHCNRIIKTKDSNINQKLTSRKEFIANVEELRRIEEKKKSDRPLTNRDSLTRKIMENELRFDFEHAKLKPIENES